MARNPGEPLSFYNNPYVPVPGSKGQRYFNIHSATTVSRSDYLNAHARAFGFEDNGDYLKFSRMFPGGLGGLSGLRIADVKRVKHMFERYERDNHLPRGTATTNNRSLAIWAQGFLEHPQSGKERNRFVNRLLDVVGIPNYTSAFFAGATP